MPSNPGCTACELHLSAHSVCLWGQMRDAPVLPMKSPAYEVMILGEAPGYNEDLQGIPFIGASGDLLKQAFKQIGFNHHYYITNAAKCFPGKKLPRKAVKACYDYLEEEIAQVKPKYILALGNTAIQRLIGKGKITELAGKEIWSAKYNCWIMPALHPAAILRSMGRYSGWLADLNRFNNLVNGKLEEEITIKTYTIDSEKRLNVLAKLLRKSKGFSFDFEATPIPWWHKDWKPYSIAFSVSGDMAAVLPLEHPDAPTSNDPYWMDTVREWAWENADLFKGPLAKVAHNRLYDTLAWWRTFGYRINTTDCSMIAVQVLNENEPKALKWQGRTVLGWPDWDIDSRLLHPWPETEEYNGWDSCATWKLFFEHYLPRLHEEGFYDYYRKLTMQNASWVERMIYRGLPIDRPYLNKQRLTALRLRKEAAERVPVKNPMSSQQVGKWLYEEMKLPILKLTPAGAPSTDVSTINQLALLGHKAAKAVLDVRKYDKRVNTYYDPIELMVINSFDGRLHPDIRMASVETGRHASFMHTLPRDSDVRSIVNVTDPGWEMVEIDFSRLEARLAAWAAAGKPRTWEDITDWSKARMLEAIRENRDTYIEMAAAALGKKNEDVTQQERQIMGKVPVLAMLYKVSWKGLRAYAWRSSEIVWTEQEAQHIWRTFNQLYPEFPRWHQSEGQKIRSRGYTRTEIGRMRRLPDALRSEDVFVEEAVRSGINMPIQGLGSDITQTAGILVDHMVSETKARIVLEIHDALLFEVRKVNLPQLVPMLMRYQTNAYKALETLGLYLPDGLLTVEEKIGPWGKGVSLSKYLATASA